MPLHGPENRKAGVFSGTGTASAAPRLRSRQRCASSIPSSVPPESSRRFDTLKAGKVKIAD